MFDIIIIGSGPAGLAAAIYAQRAMLDTLVIEKLPMSGGQILNTYEVDNYPGMSKTSGFDLGTKFREHADALGCKIVTENVKQIEEHEDRKVVITNKAVHEAKCIILATGASHRQLGVPGEEKLIGMGVSYCATCDGAFFKDKTTAVVGGGDVALEDALFLARICKKVYVVHRRDEFRGAKVLQEKVLAASNIEVLWDTTVQEIRGEEQVTEILLYNKKTALTSAVSVDGIFIAVGIVPNTSLYKEIVPMDEGGYVIAGEDCATQKAGFYAVGDLRTKQLRQVVTAAADGANAVTSAERYLNTWES